MPGGSARPRNDCRTRSRWRHRKPRRFPENKQARSRKHSRTPHSLRRRQGDRRKCRRSPRGERRSYTRPLRRRHQWARPMIRIPARKRPGRSHPESKIHCETYSPRLTFIPREFSRHFVLGDGCWGDSWVFVAQPCPSHALFSRSPSRPWVATRVGRAPPQSSAVRAQRSRASTRIPSPKGLRPVDPVKGFGGAPPRAPPDSLRQNTAALQSIFNLSA